MQIDIKSLILGIGIFCLLAATSVEIMTVKPARPENTLVLFQNMLESKDKMENLVKLGYIVKSVTCSDYGCLVVMERY